MNAGEPLKQDRNLRKTLKKVILEKESLYISDFYFEKNVCGKRM